MFHQRTVLDFNILAPQNKSVDDVPFGVLCDISEMFAIQPDLATAARLQRISLKTNPAAHDLIETKLV